MQSIRPSQVPEYLRNTSFYLGLNAIDDDEFSIPLNHMKLNTNVDTLADMTELLNTIRFWGLDIFPEALYEFASLQPFAELEPILQRYRSDLPIITTVCSIVSEVADRKVRLERAMETGNLDCVRYLHKKLGGTFRARALALAAGKGALDCLKYGLTTVRVSQLNNHNYIFAEAVRNGHMDCIAILLQKGFNLHPSYNEEADLAWIAASSGQWQVLQYLHSRGLSMHTAAIAAADAGHIDCLEYALKFHAPLRGEHTYTRKRGTLAARLARANQLKLLPLALSRNTKMDAQTALSVARLGNAEYLKLCLDRGALPYIKLIAVVAEKGHLACLQLLHQICTAKAEATGKCLNWLTYASKLGNSYLRFADVAQMTADAQKWECLRFLIEEGCEMNKSLTTTLVLAGQLELYHLAVAHGCGVSVPAASKFATDGNLDLLRHALEHGCERSEEILRVAARHGQLQCLMYAHAQGCPWSVQVTLEAARGGRICTSTAVPGMHACDPLNAKSASLTTRPCTVVHSRQNISTINFLSCEEIYAGDFASNVL